ncbi:hypothetical protein QQ020_14415 [Fulvivirgaceae bacterium BMA12]|uniref:Uncharacterized protein n=1 Tax=Agaribacillus aureus TaxID=3051825 RepID=A0ABT8L688_9BACT|nr:hypothetical protein [Fulvivirgaceae bacterium BMA12]
MKLEIKLKRNELELLVSIAEKFISNPQTASSEAKVAKSAKTTIEKVLDESIDLEVLGILSRFSGVAVEDIKKSHTLKFGLGIGDSRKLDLAVPFTRLASKYKSGAKINRSECSDLIKVSDCISLIKSKI